MSMNAGPDELSNNHLRDAKGGLTGGGLDVFEFNQGWVDVHAGTPPPELTTASYDLGRQRAAEKTARRAQVGAWIKHREAQRLANLKAILPEAEFADLERKFAELRAKYHNPQLEEVEHKVAELQMILEGSLK